MKEVTIENVKARIALLEGTERACGLTLKGDFELACLRQLLASLEAKPTWAVISSAHGSREMVTSYNPGVHVDGEKGVRLAYAVPPAPQPDVDDDVRNVIALLENNEWAEHCTSTVLGSRLESEITRLVGKAQQKPEAAQ